MIRPSLDYGRTELAAGIEAGGTKFVVGVTKSGALPSAKAIIPTADPGSTLSAVVRWLREQGVLSSLGIASFGPIELDRASPKWGHIIDTPKPGWADCDLVGRLAAEFKIPIGFDTDVNSAALAEHSFGAGKGKRSLVYITVGTGIGGGMVADGRVLEGVGHPEMGHYYPRRHREDWHFAGCCPYHGDCLEGLASGAAITARWGTRLSDLPDDHKAHRIIADYLAQFCHAMFAITAAETLVLGGGVLETPGLIERIRHRTASIGGYYLPGRERQSIVKPALGRASGLIGAIQLGRLA